MCDCAESGVGSASAAQSALAPPIHEYALM
jgi:hypothetical protein